MQKIPTSFYERDTVTVAKDLLGNFLVHYDGEVERIGKIVEVEAYLGRQDLASHWRIQLVIATLPPLVCVKNFNRTFIV